MDSVTTGQMSLGMILAIIGRSAIGFSMPASLMLVHSSPDIRSRTDSAVLTPIAMAGRTLMTIGPARMERMLSQQFQANGRTEIAMVGEITKPKALNRSMISHTIRPSGSTPIVIGGGTTRVMGLHKSMISL